MCDNFVVLACDSICSIIDHNVQYISQRRKDCVVVLWLVIACLVRDKLDCQPACTTNPITLRNSQMWPYCEKLCINIHLRCVALIVCWRLNNKCHSMLIDTTPLVEGRTWLCWRLCPGWSGKPTAGTHLLQHSPEFVYDKYTGLITGSHFTLLKGLAHCRHAWFLLVFYVC